MVDGEIKKVSLEDYKGKWVAVFFYPKDFTYVCPVRVWVCVCVCMLVFVL